MRQIFVIRRQFMCPLMTDLRFHHSFIISHLTTKLPAHLGDETSVKNDFKVGQVY